MVLKKIQALDSSKEISKLCADETELCVRARKIEQVCEFFEHTPTFYLKDEDDEIKVYEHFLGLVYDDAAHYDESNAHLKEQVVLHHLEQLSEEMKGHIKKRDKSIEYMLENHFINGRITEQEYKKRFSQNRWTMIESLYIYKYHRLDLQYESGELESIEVKKEYEKFMQRWAPRNLVIEDIIKQFIDSPFSSLEDFIWTQFVDESDLFVSKISYDVWETPTYLNVNGGNTYSPTMILEMITKSKEADHPYEIKDPLTKTPFSLVPNHTLNVVLDLLNKDSARSKKK